jgi:hypothetical protein
MKKKFVVLLAAVVLAMPGLSVAANIGQNQVVSISIKPADGTTGQNVLTGSGVKTGHIQDGAVTGQKISAGAVGTAALAPLAVGTSNIADGSVTTSKLGTAVVGTNAISDGAVTDTKISGTISGAKLGSHSHSATDISGTIATSQLPIGDTSGTIAAGDHMHDALYQKKYANVIVVSKSGGDFSDPITAINAITNASSANPYLLKILPGIYDLGANSMYMKDFIDIEGSGLEMTKLTGTVLMGVYPYKGLIVGSQFSEIRSLTIQNNINNAIDNFIGLFTQYDTKIKDVKIICKGSC